MHIPPVLLLVSALICGTFLPAHAQDAFAPRQRAREFGIRIGIMPPGPHNDITDVAGVSVGHVTIREGARLNTGVTVILPHGGNLFREKVPAAVAVGNGFGKLMGSTQVNELGELESPILLTGTLSVPRAADGLIDYLLSLPDMEDVFSVNPLVGETNDGFLSDIRARPVTAAHVRAAIGNATGGPVQQGAVGAGSGTVCFGWKGGIGSSSRKLPAELGGWTVGVLVQSNFGGVLTINGIRVGEALGKYPYRDALASADGSIIIVVATDAPLDHRSLTRLARRGFLGVARTGGYMSNGSGDYAIAFSTHADLRIRRGQDAPLMQRPLLDNEAQSPLFLAVVEATEEAIIDSLFTARTTSGHRGGVEELPVEKIMELTGSRR
jgi:D-aminopeptidase